MSGLRLCHIECYFYGVSGGNHDFQHFFQGLSVFNMLHMVVGGVVGAAVYAQGLAYYVPDNLPVTVQLSIM